MANGVGVAQCGGGVGFGGSGICIAAGCVAILVVICWAFGGGFWW